MPGGGHADHDDDGSVTRRGNGMGTSIDITHPGVSTAPWCGEKGTDARRRGPSMAGDDDRAVPGRDRAWHDALIGLRGNTSGARVCDGAPSLRASR